jgi:hypothetical protein
MLILDNFLTDSQVQKIYDANLDYHNYFLQSKEDLECLHPLLEEASKHFDFSKCVGYEVWDQSNPKNLEWHYDKDEILFDKEGIQSWPICTIIYYIRVHDIHGGNLLLEDGTSIEPIQNRLVIFGPGIEHAVEDMFTVDGNRDSIIINPWTYKIGTPEMTQERPSILSVNKALSPEDFRFVSEFAYDASYCYGERDESQYKPTGLISELCPDNDKHQEIVDIFHNLICKKFSDLEGYRLYRAYVNCFAPREVANFHQDCDDDQDQITFLFYANTTYNGLNDGGTTEFYLDEKIIAIPPIPNTLVRFTSRVLHRATPLNSEHRFTYAFKYCKEDN